MIYVKPTYTYPKLQIQCGFLYSNENQTDFPQKNNKSNEEYDEEQDEHDEEDRGRQHE